MEIVIVGAGFAGISTAYHLARRGERRITVLEKEETPGVHASGRNAGLLRQSSDDPATAGLLRDGARAARRILSGVPGALQATGSLILGEKVARLRAGPRGRLLDAGEVVAGLGGRALFDPEDALVDPQALLAAFHQRARRRGVRILLHEEMVGVSLGEGKVESVTTTRRTLPADTLVNAAGAWAGAVAGLAGSTGIAIESRRRHLFRGGLDGAADRAWPFVWHEDHGVYFRREGAGFLLSPCDAEPHRPGVPEVDPARREELAAKLAATFSALGDWRLGPGWACLRTFAPDERFLIGADAYIRGLFWVAGLGGAGLTSAWAVGRLAARTILSRTGPTPFDPRRFQRGGAAG